MVFQLQGKHFFLTYPRCFVEPADAKEFLCNKYTDIVSGVISQESHADGESHLHAFVSFRKRKNFKLADCFDIFNWHGNYQVVRNYAACQRYVRKEGVFVEWDDAESADELENETWMSQEEVDKLFDLAKNSSRVDFLRECVRRRIPPTYFNLIRASTSSVNTLEGNSEGNFSYFSTNQALLDQQWHLMNSILQTPPFTTPQVPRSPCATDPSSSLAQPVAVKQPGPSTICPNQSSSYATSIVSRVSTPDYTKLSSSTIWNSNIYRDLLKSTSSTVSNHQPYTFDIAQWISQPTFGESSPPIDTPSAPMTPQSKED